MMNDELSKPRRTYSSYSSFIIVPSLFSNKQNLMTWFHQRWLRLWEILLGLDKGFLSREGERHWHFNPHWPGQEWLDHVFGRVGFGITLWNGVLITLLAALVLYVYRREGHSKRPRILLGTMRALLLAFVLALL